MCLRNVVMFSDINNETIVGFQMCTSWPHSYYVMFFFYCLHVYIQTEKRHMAVMPTDSPNRCHHLIQETQKDFHYFL